MTNTDDWLPAIAAGAAVGVTAATTPALHAHPAVRFIPLIDVPPIPVVLAWTDPPTHPAVPEVVSLVRQVIGEHRS